MTRAGAATVMDDRRTRVVSQQEFGRPVVVVAGAGTGKTTLLVARIVAWCAGPGWSHHAGRCDEPSAVARRVMERVVAITFTEKAAAEMAERVARALVELASGTAPLGWAGNDIDRSSGPSMRERAEALLDEVHRLRIQTIHAFCQALLRERPLDAGVHPEFGVDADGERVEKLSRLVVEEAVRNLESQPAESWRTLASCGFGPSDVASVLIDLVQAGVDPRNLEDDPFPDDAAVGVAQRLNEALDEIRRRAEGPIRDVGGNSGVLLREVCDLGTGLQGIGGRPTFDALAELVASLDPRAVTRLGDWADGTFNSREGKALGESSTAVAAAAQRLVTAVEPLQDLRVTELRAAYSLIKPLLSDLRSRMRCAGVLTFGDLLVRALEVVTGSERTCAEVRSGIDQLLVDEFQDTDDVQCRIVARLGLAGERRPGLFIVGDPKQSIYGWRNADLEAYEEFVETVQANNGLLGRLDRNFRSAEAILDEVTRMVEPVMRFENGVQPEYQRLVPTGDRIGSPGYDREPHSGVEHWIPSAASAMGEARQSTEETTRIEAAHLARDILGIHRDHHVPWGDFAVLLRSASEQEKVIERFRELGIPYDVARERAYYRQREVVEMAALVRVILEPADHLALLTVLRGDAVGVPDVALAPLWDGGFPAKMSNLRGDDTEDALNDVLSTLAGAEREVAEIDCPSNTQHRWPVLVRSAVQAIARLRRSFREDPPDLFVERMRSLWPGDAVAGARFLGRFRMARLNRFFHQLEDSLTAPTASWSDTTRALRRAVEEGRESRLPPEPDMSRDAVHVMTIHAAKGLDFEHVYLVQTHRKEKGGTGNDPVVVLRGDRGPEMRLLGWPTAGFARARRSEMARDAAERVRLLYVALTRARSRLVVSGAGMGGASRGASTGARNLGDLVGVRGDRDAIEAQLRTAETRRFEPETGVQWVALGSLATEEPESGTAAAEATTGFESGRAAADFEMLTNHRGRAAQRMSRSLSGRISGGVHDALPADDSESPRASRLTGEIDRDQTQLGARIVGTGVHWMLEHLDLTMSLRPQLPGLAERAALDLGATLRPELRAEVERRLMSLVEVVGSGSCIRRLEEIADHVLARELPVLVPPSTESHALSFVSGTVDLVYRDPDNGEVVVADYKTDRLATPEDLDDRSAVYALQVTAYSTAIAAALSLSETPRAELWFLDADRIMVVEKPLPR